MTTLPIELIQLQLEQFDLLQSLFLPGEWTPSQATTALSSHLQSQLDLATMPIARNSSLDCTVVIQLDVPPAALPGEYSIQLSISLPLQDPAPPPRLTLHQPSWLSRSTHQSLSDSLASLPAEDDPTTAVLGALELVRELGSAAIPLVEEVVEEVGGKEEVRVWFWLQSLSTREKRNDMVNWAPGFGLTGFVMAGQSEPLSVAPPLRSADFCRVLFTGKPGLLCLEGNPKLIQEYMNDIKSVSWADIPVSSRITFTAPLSLSSTSC